jgi:MFS transporter, DHA1 family, multidrug/chloramphenicol efflux transport protein
MPQPLINISRKQAYIFAAFLVLYEFLTYVANDMIMPGMIDVVKTFNGSEDAVASSLTAYILGGASLQLILGPLSDRYGRRPIMIFGAAFFLITTLVIAASNSMEQFLVARFFQGMGLCFTGVIGYAVIQEIFAEMDAIRLIALMANVSILAPLIGPLLGALFIHYYSWRWIFIIIAVFSFLALYGICRYMPEPVGQTKTDGDVIPIVPLSFGTIFTNYKNLVLNRTFLLGSIAFGVVIVPCIAWIALSPLILIASAKLSVIEYAVWQIPIFGAAIAGNLFLQGITRHFTSSQVLKIGSAICCISLLIVVTLPLMFGNHFLWLMPGLIIYFFGLGVTGGPLNRIVLFSTSVSKGTASALLALITACIEAGGVELANLLYDATYNNRVFAVYCATTGVLYIFILIAAFYKANGQTNYKAKPEPHQ